MPILNYTTTVAVEKTAAEIQVLLGRKGARRILVDYDEHGSPAGLMFNLQTPQGNRGFRLPANVAGVWQYMVTEHKQGRLQPRFVTKDQAARVAWRIALTWLQAQLALIEAGMATADQVLMPYMLVDQHTTLYELYSSGQLALPSGTEGR